MDQKEFNFPTEQEYRAAEGTSQSSLGYLVKHPKFYYHKLFVKTTEPRKDYFVIGGALDCLLTSPADFAATYIEEPEDSPNSAMMLKLCEEYVKQRYVNHCDEEMSFQMAHNESGYKAGLDGIRKKFDESEIQHYIKFLKNKGDRIILKRQEAITVRHMAKLLTKSPHCGWLFDRENIKEGITILYQLPVFFTCQDVKCKGLLDIVVIDHNNKTIQPIDLKTTGKSVHAFRKSFITFNYYLQAAFYSRGLEIWKNNFEGLGDISQYKMLNFKFLVQEKACYNKPMFFNTSDNDLKIGKLGGYLKAGEQYIKGYIELLDELKWHRKEDYWEMPKDAVASNFEVELDVFRTN